MTNPYLCPQACLAQQALLGYTMRSSSRAEGFCDLQPISIKSAAYLLSWNHAFSCYHWLSRIKPRRWRSDCSTSTISSKLSSLLCIYLTLLTYTAPSTSRPSTSRPSAHPRTLQDNHLCSLYQKIFMPTPYPRTHSHSLHGLLLLPENLCVFAVSGSSKSVLQFGNEEVMLQKFVLVLHTRVQNAVD